MFEEDKPVEIRELQWLARYYKMHGHSKEAREILEAIASHSLKNEKQKGTNEPVIIYHDDQQSTA